MFVKIEYKLLIDNYMTRDEYNSLINKYMNKFNISYISAIQYITRKQIKRFEKDYNISYEKAVLNEYYEITKNDIIENYNISSL